MSGPKRRLYVTPAQATYLLELVQDDLVVTELTPSERLQARAVRDKLADLLRGWDTGFDPNSTGQSPPRV